MLPAPRLPHMNRGSGPLIATAVLILVAIALMALRSCGLA